MFFVNNVPRKHDQLHVILLCGVVLSVIRNDVTLRCSFVLKFKLNIRAGNNVKFSVNYFCPTGSIAAGYRCNLFQNIFTNLLHVCVLRFAVKGQCRNRLSSAQLSSLFTCLKSQTKSAFCFIFHANKR